MPGIDHQLFQIELSVAEAGHRLGPGLLKGPVDVLRAGSLAHPPAAPSGGRLQQDGIAHLLRQSLGLAEVFQGSVRAGHHRHPGAPGQGPGGGFAAQLPDHISGRADVLQSRLDAPVSKVGIFRQKAVAGVDGVAFAGQGGGEDSVLI